MYYDNKSNFYIRQYGPKVMLIVFSIVLIISGIYIYCSSTNINIFSKGELVASNNNIVDQNTNQTDTQTKNEEKTEETNSLKEENTIVEVKLSENISENMNSLSNLQKYGPCTVDSITSDLKIVIKDNNTLYQVNLIGIDYTKSNSNIQQVIENDLKGKTIYISFDKLKVKDSQIYAYVYINDELYNKKLLNDGLAILKVERTNTSLLDQLLEGQLFAKSNSKGIWSK